MKVHLGLFFLIPILTSLKNQVKKLKKIMLIIQRVIFKFIPEGAAQRKMGNNEKLDKLILFTKNFSFDKNSNDLSHARDKIISLLSKHIENIEDLCETNSLHQKISMNSFIFQRGILII